MDPITKDKGPKLVQIIKAFLGCTALFCIPGVIITFMAASFTIELTRVNSERVDATAAKNILFIVPISGSTINNLIDPESQVIDGGVIRQGKTATPVGRITDEVEDEGLLLLRGAQGEQVEVYVSPRNLEAVEDEIRYFINEGEEPSLRMWVVSNWKFGVILPGAVLLFCLVVFFISAWSIITGRQMESERVRVSSG
jgi:hypothetical protein